MFRAWFLHWTTKVFLLNSPKISIPPSPGVSLKIQKKNEYLRHHHQEPKKNVHSRLSTIRQVWVLDW